MALPEGILEAVKNYVDITWSDTNEDKKLTGIIERGMKYLNDKSNKNLDYTLEAKPRELLLDYCDYARSHALNEFQANFLHELIMLKYVEGVEIVEVT